MPARLSIFFLVIILLLTACNGTGTVVPATSQVTRHQFITLGLVDNQNSGAGQKARLLVDYLAGQLASEGILSGQVRIANSVEEMARLLADGEVDLYIDSVYPAIRACERSGAVLLLRSWQFGAPESHAVIFASRNSNVLSLSDLPGKILVMSNREATTGFFLPTTFLLENGLKMVGKNSYTAPVEAGEVGFTFSGSDEGTLQAVLNGEAAAGVVDDYQFDVAFPPEVTQKLLVLARTPAIARQVVIVRPNLESNLRTAIEKILLKMDKTEAGMTALTALQTSRFENFPEGAETAHQKMHQMLEMVLALTMP